MFLLDVMCHSDKSLPSAPLSTGNYLHKKFKKVATADDCPEVAAVPAPVLSTDEYSVEGVWRHKCPYCKTVCTKPSALAKHLQVHSDERPFPCDTCGFAFKTKSNLSKHCKSQSHTERLAKEEPEDTKPKIYKPKFRTSSIYTELEGDGSKDLETVIENVPILSYKQEEDSSQPLNLSVASIKKYQDKTSPVENGQNELKGVYKFLLNQINKCNGNKEQPFCETCGLKFNNKEDLARHICDRSPNEIKYPETKTVAMPLPSPGPLLGRTPLVEFHRSKEPEVPKPILVRMGNLGQQQEMLAIFQCSRDLPYVPGIPGPNTVMPHQLRPHYEPKKSEPPPSKKQKLEDEFVVSTSHHQVIMIQC